MSAVWKKTGKLPTPALSTEQLVDCEKKDDGCDGGDIPEAVRYLKKKGMATNAEYPDTSRPLINLHQLGRRPAGRLGQV